MTFEQIVELANLVADRHLDGLEIERSGFRLHISGRSAAGHTATVQSAVAEPSSGAPGDPASEESAEVAAPEIEGHILKSPIVGTFYEAPSPDAEPFARIGDRVKKGQVVCIVEAMKLMNEIESDADGVILRVLPKNAQPVEYGEPLFLIQTGD